MSVTFDVMYDYDISAGDPVGSEWGDDADRQFHVP